MHILAYHLIRGVMAKAAKAHDKRPRQISFKGALQAMTAFQDALRRAAPKDRERLMQTMLEVIRNTKSVTGSDGSNRAPTNAGPSRSDFLLNPAVKRANAY
jgi:hypothetical protein